MCGNSRHTKKLGPSSFTPFSPRPSRPSPRFDLHTSKLRLGFACSLSALSLSRRGTEEKLARHAHPNDQRQAAHACDSHRVLHSSPTSCRYCEITIGKKEKMRVGDEQPAENSVQASGQEKGRQKQPPSRAQRQVASPHDRNQVRSNKGEEKRSGREKQKRGQQTTGLKIERANEDVCPQL